MSNKGFTLIEVIAVLVVLVAIFLVSFPALNNAAKSDEDKLYDNMIDNLCSAGKAYMYSNMDKFPDLSVKNSKIQLKISKLISYGNVEKNLINPKTNVSIERDLLEYIVLNDFSLDCKYIEG